MVLSFSKLGDMKEEGEVCRMGFGNAELQVLMKRPRQNLPGAIGNTSLNLKREGWVGPMWGS